MQCLRCGKESNTKFCPDCGAQMPLKNSTLPPPPIPRQPYSGPPKKKKSKLMIAAIVVAAVIVLSIIGNTIKTVRSVSDADASSSDLVQNIITSQQQDSSLAVASQPQNDSSQTPIELGEIKVHFLDVAQGDSTFIELPNNETMLIDAGESSHGSFVASYILMQGYEKIDYLVATHPHSDHIGGLATILDTFEVGTAYLPDVIHTTSTYETFLQALIDKRIDTVEAKVGVDIIDLPDFSVSIVSPVLTNYIELNDWSAVIHINYKGASYLFMGDAESAAEAEISQDIKADVISIGHHGSSSSTTQEFLSQVTPKHAIISCGTGNDYGHPHDEVLARLDDNNISVYRTDTQGTIVLVSDGAEYSFDKEPSPYQPQAPPESQVDASVPASQQEVPQAPPAAPQPAQEPTQAPPVDTQPEPEPPPEAPTQGRTVYITKTGEKHHAGGCRYLSKSQIPISIDDAIARGYTACSVCGGG